MGKGKGKGGKKGKSKKDIDWSAEENFDKNRSMIYIEHTHECPIFLTKAEEFVAFVQEEIPERMFQLVRNSNGKVPPRPGAFEIDFAQNARTSKHCIWSGLERGPPRRDKFPVFTTLLPEIRVILKKFYPDLNKMAEDELEED